ncbi:spinster family MFS transporter [Acinetobacter courvalinii]|uniref:spinster family MFS transporter n=1 Tax=Acinetobacter courvalinii TaxID=280147 RepID=UPI003F565322
MSYNKLSNKWKVLFLLFLANFLNFFDRTIPAIIMEPLRLEYQLSDLKVGLIAAAFTLIYAIAGLPLGRLADVGSRKNIMSCGLMIWSGFTALNSLAWNYWSFLLIRLGVGVGEASYAPAASSLISDLFPAKNLAKAMGIFMLGLPLGVTTAFFTVGTIVNTFESWRAPFIIAAIPGVLLAILIFLIKEPTRIANNTSKSNESVKYIIKILLKIKTLRWLILSGITLNFASYAGTAFLVPLLQRYYSLNLINAGLLTGCIIGITGIIGLIGGGWISDKAQQLHKRGRLIFGTLGMLISALGSFAALYFGKSSVLVFAIYFGTGWLAIYSYHVAVYPAIQEVVPPRSRATAVGLYFASMYILGGAFGPLLLGALSDYLANQAMIDSGGIIMKESFKAIGLYNALYLIPIMLFLTAIFLFKASSYFYDESRNFEEN